MAPSVYQEQVNSFNQLINLINPQASEAEMQLNDFLAEIKNNTDSDMSVFTLMIMFKEVTQWKSSYYVDWKDTESLVASLNKIAEPWQAHINWGVDDPMDKTFLNNTDVHTLLDQIYDQFTAQGLRLWGYDTSGEDYAGWIAKIEHDDEISTISETLGLDFYIECTGFFESQFDQSKLCTSDISNDLSKNLLRWEILKPMLKAFPQTMRAGSFKTRISLFGGLIAFVLICAVLMPIMFFLKSILKLLGSLRSKNSNN